MNEATVQYNEELHMKINSILIDMNRVDDIKRAAQNEAYQEQLMLELLPEEMQNI